MMKFAFTTFLITLLWLSALASDSGSASDERDDNGEDNQHPLDNILNKGIDRHIINGQKVDIIDVPFQCIVLYQSHFCGCAIISRNWVVTAAHCIERGQTAAVVAGITKLDDIPKPASRILRLVPFSMITIHPEYNRSNIFSPDIALLHIVPPFLFNSAKVQPIRLIQDTSVPHRLDWLFGFVSGWGVTEYSEGYASEELMLGRVAILPHSMCPPENETSRILCTVSYPSTVCHGDNGGPLFIIGPDRRPTLVGIISIFNDYCSIMNPVGNTFLGAHRAWIRNVTGI